MKSNVLLGTISAAAFAVGLSAQTGGQAGTASPSQNQLNQPITVTGCLQSADMAGGAAAGTSGSTASGSAATGTGTSGSATQTSGAAASAKAGQFVLTKAKITPATTTGTGTTGSAAGAATSGTSGTGTGSAAGASDRFTLTGGNQEELKKYVNSQVEIQGNLVAAGSAAGSGTGAAAGTGTAAGTGAGMTGSQSSMKDAPRLRVTSVKQLSPSCL